MSYKIDRYDDFGRGITFKDNKICFISNALKDEEVEFSITNEKSKYIEGVSTEIIKSSDDRKDSDCPYYLECGGCSLLHMKYNSQLDYKKNKVENALKKFAGLNNVVKEILPTKEIIYRNKITLKVQNGIIGYFKNKTNELVEIDKCLLASGAINKTIKTLKLLKLDGVEEIVIRSNYKGDVLLYLKGNNIDSNYYKDKLYKVDNIVILNKNKKEIIKGNDYIIDAIEDLLFKVSIDSFFQVNSYGVNVLYNKVLDYSNLTNKETVLDLYCGTGTIGLFLSKKAKQVYGVEINKSAVNDANFNKELNKSNNIEFICSDVSLIKDKYKDIDLTIIDPPREGLSKEALENVISINSKRIIYVSCDPITLSRDLNILKEYYEIKEVTVVDMFPNTYHVECVCLLMKK